MADDKPRMLITRTDDGDRTTVTLIGNEPLLHQLSQAFRDVAEGRREAVNVSWGKWLVLVFRLLPLAPINAPPATVAPPDPEGHLN